MTVNPCEVGLCCPFEHFDEDGMAFCSYPDINPKCRREYPVIMSMDGECDLYPAPDSPLEQLIEGYGRVQHEPRAYRTAKVTVEIRRDDRCTAYRPGPANARTMPSVTSSSIVTASAMRGASRSSATIADASDPVG